jgi:hypothetical protein
MMNKNDPLKGAVIGGTLGFGGGTLLGPALGATAPGIAGAGAAGTGAATGVSSLSNAAYGALPGITPGGAQAAALAAQTGQAAGPGAFGLQGLLSTGASAAKAQGISPMTASLFDFGAKASLPASQSQISQLNMAGKMIGGNQQPQQQAQIMPAPAMPISRRQPTQYPTLDEMYKMQMAQAAPRFSLI